MRKYFLLKRPLKVSILNKLKMAPLPLYNSKIIIYLIKVYPTAYWGGVAICVPTDGHKVESFLKAFFKKRARGDHPHFFLNVFINIL
jgi:hypothetical protein